MLLNLSKNILIIKHDQLQLSNYSLISSGSNQNGNNILSGTTSSIGLAQSILLTSKTTTPTSNNLI